MPATTNSYDVKDEEGVTIGQITVSKWPGSRVIARFMVDGVKIAEVDMDRVYRELKVFYISEENGYDHYKLAQKLVLACVLETPKILDGLKEVYVNEEIEYWGKEMNDLSFIGLDEKPFPKCVRAMPDDDPCRMRAPIMEVIGEEEVGNVKRVKIM
jgi:hypothetical protein